VKNKKILSESSISMIIGILVIVFSLVLGFIWGRLSITTGNLQSVHVNISENIESYIPEKIDLNSASIEALQTLPYIGKEKAQSIIDNRPFYDIAEIKRIEGIGDKIYQVLKDKLEVK